MKKIVLLLVFIILAVMLVAENIEINSPMGTFKMSVNSSSSSSKKIAVVDEISNKLEILNKKYCSQLNKLKQRKANKLIDEIYDLLAMLPEDIYVNQTTSSSSSSSTISSNQNANININVNTPEVVTTHKKIVEEKPVTSSPAMSENAFQTLYNNVNNESFADDKLSVIKIATKRNSFKVSQLTRLLDLFSFADDKVKCTQVVYPKVIDKENAHQIINHFTSSGDKKKVEAIINQ